MASSSSIYGLRAELRGHEEDVRALCVTPAGLVTTSRDNTAKVWGSAAQDANAFECKATLVGHTSYVTCAAPLPASDTHPLGGIVTGSRDTTLAVWDPATASRTATLSGHQYQVTAVLVTPTPTPTPAESTHSTPTTIYSAALDGSIRVWHDTTCKQVLDPKQGPVQCLATLDDGALLSGGNDGTVRVWRDGVCVATIAAHQDTVRGMARVGGLGVVTVSHDLTGKVWTASGECIADLIGHTAIIYSVAVAPTGHVLATASEDGTVRVWHMDGTLQQTIQHPGCVWAVVFLDNGDLVSACADGVARVWSVDPTRQADAETMQAYEAALIAKAEAAAAAAASTAGGSTGEGGGALPAGLRLEDPSVLVNPGQRDGEVKVVREDGAGVAYQWSASGQSWEKIGTVMGGDDTMAPATKMFNGQVFDYVFDVDVEDGVPPRKLALNRGDNPYDVADSFLIRENLPVSYREQIVQFILQNTQDTAAFHNPVPMNVDPYTGSGAYVPGTAGPVPGSRGPAGGVGNGYAVTGGGADPYTGGQSGGGGGGSSHVPCRVYLVFDNVPKADALLGKLQEFQAALTNSDESSLALTDTSALTSLVQRAVAPRNQTTPMSDIQAHTLTLLLQWPAGRVFPAIDLCRLLSLSPATAGQVAQITGTWADANSNPLTRASQDTSATPAHLTALRFLCNCFQAPALTTWLTTNREMLLDAFAGCTSSSNKNVRQALAALLLNFAVAALVQRGGEGGRGLEGNGGEEGDATEWLPQVLSAVLELMVNAPGEDVETWFRCAVAVGTIASCGAGLVRLAQDLGFVDVLKEKQGAVRGQAGGDKAVGAMQETLQVLV